VIIRRLRDEVVRERLCLLMCPFDWGLPMRRLLLLISRGG
jgi:hypothetical protein